MLAGAGVTPGAGVAPGAEVALVGMGIDAVVADAGESVGAFAAVGGGVVASGVAGVTILVPRQAHETITIANSMTIRYMSIFNFGVPLKRAIN